MPVPVRRLVLCSLMPWVTCTALLERRKLPSCCHPGGAHMWLQGIYRKHCCSSCYHSAFHPKWCGKLCDKRCLSPLDLYSQFRTHQPCLNNPGCNITILAFRDSLCQLWWQPTLPPSFMKTFLPLPTWSGTCLINLGLLALVGDICQGTKTRGIYPGTDVHQSKHNCRKKRGGGEVG